MAKFRVTSERLDLCDESDIRMAHYSVSSDAAWFAWTPAHTVACRAEIARGDPAAVRAVCERLAGDYPAVLAFVRFGIALLDVEPANCAGCGHVVNAPTATSLHNHLTHQRDLVCVPCANEPGPSVYHAGVA